MRFNAYHLSQFIITFLMDTLNEACPNLETGVYKIPFNPTLFRRSDAKVSFIRSSLRETCPDKSNCSHSIGTSAALKTAFTDSDSSCPTPSPGTKVTVCV